MQTGRGGERGANPTRGIPLSVYGSHLAHVGGKVSVTTPSSVTCTALSRHVAIGSYTQEPHTVGLSWIYVVHFSLPLSMVFFGLAIICDQKTPRASLLSGRARLIKLSCTISQ